MDRRDPPGVPDDRGPLGTVVHHGQARRIVLSFALFNGAEYATWVALMVLAFTNGGAAESGVVAVSQLVPAGLLAPVTGAIAERGRPERLLALGYWIQGVALGLAALSMLVESSVIVTYSLVGVMTIACSTARPAQALVTPRLARSAHDLTAINVVTEWTAQAAICIAPAIAGGLLAVSGPGLVFGFFAVALFVAGILAASLLGATNPPIPARANGHGWREVRAGVRVAVSEPAVRVVLVMSAAGFVVVGALDVLAVVFAVERLHAGGSAAAWLTAAFGAGGVFGAAVSGALVGRRLAPALAVATIGFGLAVAVLGTAPARVLAFAMFFTAGTGQVIATVAGNSLLQRCAPSESVGRVFAIREALYCFGLAVGSVLTPILIATVGIDATFLLVGAGLPVYVLLRLVTIWRLDRSATVPIVELTLLRGIPIFAGLPAPALEGLARAAAPITFGPGAVLMREGDPGDRYLAIVDGTAEVSKGGVPLVARSRGDGVGETALLHEVPRTATVRATTAVHALTLSKRDFLVAVTGHAPTYATALDIATRHRSADPT